MIICVLAPALPHLRPALRLDGPARPVIGLQGRRAARSFILASHPAICGSRSVTCAKRGMPPGGWRLTMVTIVLPAWKENARGPLRIPTRASML